LLFIFSRATIDPMNQSDIYCEKILSGKLPVKVIRETETFLAFEHTNPFWATHIVVIPKVHIESLAKITVEQLPIVQELMEVASEICSDLEQTLGGCRLSTNVGSYQTSKHLHFYIHSGERLRPDDGPILHE
jgi:histidine triad (HIT) family protein